MKKITTILMALLLLVSSFTFVVSAEGEAVNYATNATYEYDGATTFLSSEDGSRYFGDDACTILTDGVSPFYTTTTEDGKVIAGSENPGESIILAGSGAVHTFTFDLGATYDDITEITFSNVWDSVSFGWENGENGKGNRGFSYDKAIINISANDVGHERTKDYEIIKKNHTEDGSENGYYDITYKFNNPATAKTIQFMIFGPAYCLSFSELEIWGKGHSIPTPEAAESSEEIIEESSDEAIDESVEESAEESKAESKAEESKAEESKAASKAENSKADDDGKDGSVLPIVIAVVAVVAVAVVVVIVIKKKKN
jgi:hypothetical protein